ncbi:hypothetical protein QQX98_009423 [Neonectria punicea]|uniref:Uncharacterized protein n=1 Tax=Neonectria punicea TaxID=979145 RepID=A0ABR1GSL6_9HYPO
MRSSILSALVLGAMVPYAACLKLIQTENAQYVNDTRLCEKNKKVPTHAGFIKVGEKNEQAKMWFHFTEARQLPAERHLVIYIGDGPGIAGSYDMLAGTGPCKIHPTRFKSVNNKFSINEWTDILYVDTPVGTGFSKGNSYIDTTETATEYMLEFLYKFFKEFPAYDFRYKGLWGVGYGAHLATSLAAEILSKNAECNKEKCPSGYNYIPINSLGLDSPHLDLTLQHKAAIDYASDNGYAEIISPKDRDHLKKEFAKKYQERWSKCGSAKYMDCEKEVQEHKALWKNLTDGVGPRRLPRLGRKVNPEDVRKPRKDHVNTVKYLHKVMDFSKEARWLNQSSVQKKVGLLGGKINDKKISHTAFNLQIYDKFWESQDVIRSSLADLEYIVKCGIRTLILGGDADIIANHIGLRQIAEGIEWRSQKKFKDAKYLPLAIPRERDGAKDVDAYWQTYDAGEFKTVDNLTLMKFRGVGHNLGKRKPGYLTYIFDKHSRGRRF